MSKITTKTEIMVSNGRIIDAKVLADGRARLTIETNKVKALKDDMFVLIEASKISMYDDFMLYCPQTVKSKVLKQLLTKVIKKGVKDFFKPTVDPSFENGKIYFEAGNIPETYQYYEWWEEMAERFWPDRGSRLGTKFEYVAFLGVLIKRMVEKGWNVEDAWSAVCCDSKKIGHFCDSIDSKNGLELTGSIEVCGFCDLGNTYKILADEPDEWSDRFLLAGGSYLCRGTDNPLTHIGYCYRDIVIPNSVGWLVLSI